MSVTKKWFTVRVVVTKGIIGHVNREIFAATEREAESSVAKSLEAIDAESLAEESGVDNSRYEDDTPTYAASVEKGSTVEGRESEEEEEIEEVE